VQSAKADKLMARNTHRNDFDKAFMLSSYLQGLMPYAPLFYYLAAQWCD
jgi:hypothetical protein